jgi:hypothetical protein
MNRIDHRGFSQDWCDGERVTIFSTTSEVKAAEAQPQFTPDEIELMIRGLERMTYAYPNRDIDALIQKLKRQNHE